MWYIHEQRDDKKYKPFLHLIVKEQTVQIEFQRHLASLYVSPIESPASTPD